ncbi:DMT family transporter [Desulfovibrio inopinatus]|uniref:DMT family transporter n=1 Tax=Desulfovibrio inopinatus TaxID=102109 RepID=UPI0009FC3583|nr:EamA family transporter [Desulfovibrio inopinatus]
MSESAVPSRITNAPRTESRQIALAYCYVFLAAIMWGLIGPLSKYAFSQGMGTVDVGFWRTTLAFVMYAVHACVIKEVRIYKADIPIIFAFGICGIAGLFGFYVVAVREGGAALASVLLYTAPAWVALLSYCVLKERMTVLKIAAVATTIVGVALVSFGPNLFGHASLTFTTAAIVFGLLSGFSYALYYIFGKKFLSRYKTPTLLAYAMPVGALALAPFCSFSIPNPESFIACIGIAFVSTYGAYSVYYAGLKHLEATRASVVATMEPVVASVVAYFWFGEHFDYTGYVGAGLILGSVLLTVWDGVRDGNGGKRKSATEGKDENSNR